jgi:hypothetical protein
MAGISKIKIDQQLAEIGVRSTPARMHISTPRMQMRISSETPQMEIDRQAPTFKINRRRINSESGLKAAPELSKDYRDKGRAGALRGTKTAVDDGNFLGETRRRGDRVGQLARNKTMSAILKKQQLNVGLMPKSLPEVTWDKGHMRINWSKHSLVIDWDGEYMPQLTIDPKYNIEIFLRTEPYFRVTVEDFVDPGRPGRFVDQAI